LGSVGESPLAPRSVAGEVPVTPLLIVDDGLRRTFIHNLQVRQVLEQESPRNVRIKLWQQVAEQAGGVGRIGRATRVTPFDEFGRRIYEMQSTEGNLSIVQGITQVTPVYTKVQGLMGANRPIVWDMRIATSSIPRETLSRILTTSVPQKDVEARLQVVRLYLQSERYHDAREELEEIVKQFPDRKELEQEVRQLRQLGAGTVLREIRLRGAAGQHQLAHTLLTNFPSEGVAGETLQEVRELVEKYSAERQRRHNVLAELAKQVAAISDDNGRRLAEEFGVEISAETNEDTIGRLASFERLADDEQMTPEQKAALAISGWLVGANQATDDFQLAISLAQVREKIRAYLREPLAANRPELANELHDMESATIERVAQILKLMKPPIDVPKDAVRGPGLYELTVRGLTGESDSRYFIQLPPEYDPLRHYPTIVTLADAGVTAEQMLDFWAGPANAEKGGERLGQASRYGYITIAVDWQTPHQFTYDYTAREHHVVLGAVRDACRRFAVDSDRVFLTGHGIGGDAAWDIGLAHPDIWAGVMPIVAVADRYCTRYWPNARYVPWYFVGGELDGDKMAHNALVLDRMMKPACDTTVVEYLGRGYEPFGDEIQRLFDWMGRRRRTMPKEIEYVTMRPWDNFCWWLEVEGVAAKSMVAPGNWPAPRGARAAQIESKRAAANKISVKAQAAKTTVWLSPELVNFQERIEVQLNGRSLGPRDRIVAPDLTVLLEDVRTRADRQHPFWAKLTTGSN
jgi:pimeloyl-ACP methyl ester carboxylesterase